MDFRDLEEVEAHQDALHLVAHLDRLLVPHDVLHHDALLGEDLVIVKRVGFLEVLHARVEV